MREVLVVLAHCMPVFEGQQVLALAGLYSWVASVDCSYFLEVGYKLAFLEHCIVVLVLPPWVVGVCNTSASVLACEVLLALPCMLVSLEDCIWVVHMTALVPNM